MTLKFLTKQETKNILEKLNKQFGIKKIPGILIKKGEERIFIFQGEFNEKEIKKLESFVPIERVGVYFGKIFEPTDEMRLSIEGTQILKDQITKNIFELNEKQIKTWMEGQEILINTNLKGIIIIKYKNDFLGCGKASENKIGNFIPKNRRLKIKNE